MYNQPQKLRDFIESPQRIDANIMNLYQLLYKITINKETYGTLNNLSKSLVHVKVRLCYNLITILILSLHLCSVRGGGLLHSTVATLHLFPVRGGIFAPQCCCEAPLVPP